MTKDKELEEIFLYNKPEFNDQDAFMQKLERKLDAVEFIRQHEEANRRRYRNAVLIAFVMGIISGGVLVLVQPDFNVMITLTLMILLSYGVVFIVTNIIEIAKMLSDRNSLSYRRYLR